MSSSSEETTVPRITAKYHVSFNTERDGYAVGDSSANSVDFFGDDIDALADEVVDSDPNDPLTFDRVQEDDVVGLFKSGDGFVVAIMFTS